MSWSDSRDLFEHRPEARDHLERGRAHFGRREWADAFRSLSLADAAAALPAADLELLAMAAYLRACPRSR